MTLLPARLVPRTRRWGLPAIVSAVLGLWPLPSTAQDAPAEEQAVIAVAHAALGAISKEDPIGLTDLMIEGATFVALPQGGGVPRVSTRQDARSRPMDADFVERGFDARAEVAGELATVWMPYDFYINGEWSHCGVDLFTLVRVDDAWLISSLAYSVEQPPACSPHPEGPPGL
jgi:hypothetical protein